MKRLNENVAYAKSILNKLGISNDSELYNDYLKIREICGVNTEKENKSKENKTKEDKSKENKTKGKFIRNFFDFSI